MIQGPPTYTLGRIFKARVEKSTDRYAIGWIENSEVKNQSYREYKKTIEILVAAYNKIGINVGEKVAILAQTCKEWHYLDLAALIARNCVVPIYPSYLAHEVDYIFKNSDSSVLIIENDKQMEKILPVMQNWPNLKIIISMTDLSEDNLKKFRNVCSYYSYKDLIRLGTDELKTHPDLLENHINHQMPEEDASIIYTSGTTGEPKGAVITQAAFATMLKNIEHTVEGAFTQNDKSLVFLPLSHVLGRCDSMLPLVFGWQSVYAESLEKIVDNINVVQPTIMIAVPRIFEKIYAKIMAQTSSGNMIEKQVFKTALKVAENYFKKIDNDLSPSATELLEFKLAQKLVFSKIYNKFGGKIRYFVSGGAPLSAEIIKFLRYANLTILEGYGLTETIAPCCLNPLAKQVAGTVGRPIGDVQFSFGPDGEILIKSQAMFKEYYKNPEATKEALKDGWFYSGDIGEFTPEGYLKITDRKKDLIKTSGGKYIAPQKIENMAKLEPHISHIIAIGDGKKFLTALIGIEKERFLSILDDLGLSTDCSIEDLAKNEKVVAIIQKEIDHINHDLAQFETIKKFTILPEEFTIENFLTPSLKIKRKVVSTRYASIIEAMYQ
jgi:long-chain acyl-CoA synthetase